MARKSAINIDEEIEKIVSQYVGNANAAILRSAKKAAAAAAKELRSESPKRTGAYADDWTYTTRGDHVVVYNRKHYQLTHLLENGHQLRAGGRTLGSVAPQIHIAPVARRAGETFLQLTMKEMGQA